jgi:uncharacterized protein (TIGR03437 family)
MSLAGGVVRIADAQPVVFTVLNSASSNAFISPGCWVSIYGVNLATTTQPANGTLTPTLGGISVAVASLPALLNYVSPTQVNALIPFEVAIPANTVVPLVVTSAAGSSTYNLRLTREAPAIFRVFDGNFKALSVVNPNDVLVLYAAGLGPVDSSGRLVDPVDVYLGERKAQVLYAGLAPGIPGVYQLNVVAPRMATDRLYLRSGGYQSTIVYVPIGFGSNMKSISNIRSSITATFSIPGSLTPGLPPPELQSYPQIRCSNQAYSEACVDDGLPFMLHAGLFSVSFDILPSAAPFDVAAVGEGGGVIISINPAAGTYTASVATLSDDARNGSFQNSTVPLWDYRTCNSSTAVCSLRYPPGGIPGGQLPAWWSVALRTLPAPNVPGVWPSAFVETSGVLNGSHFAVDSQTNSALSRFGGIVQLPYGPFDSMVSTFTLYIDGVAVTTAAMNYLPAYRCFTAGPLCLGAPGPFVTSPQLIPF